MAKRNKKKEEKAHFSRQELKYLSHPDHRNGNTNKSQWTVGVCEEAGIFEEAKKKNWIEKKFGWGAFFLNGEPSTLGKSASPCRPLYFAKFVGPKHSENLEWHGYPGDACRSDDHPSQAILTLWNMDTRFPKRFLRRLIRGQL